MTTPARRTLTTGRWRRRARELLEMFVIPAVCTLLPWRLSCAWLGTLARWPGWFRDEVLLSTTHAHRAGMAPDPEAFARRLRWRLLVISVDSLLVLVRRRRRYIQRWVRASGDALPDKGPVLFIGTHYGCGYWLLPYLCQRGLPLNVVAPRPDTLLVRSSLQEHLYLRLRLRLVAHAAGRPLVYRSNAAGAISDLLRAGEVGFGLCDMPTNRADAVPVELAGLPTRLAQNMFELAARTRAPVYIFWSDTDLSTGMRNIHFRRLADATPEDQVREFAAMLSGLIRTEPAGWRFWSIAPSFFPWLAADHADVRAEAGDGRSGVPSAENLP